MPVASSRSRVGTLVVELVTSGGSVGVDAETLSRVALNATDGDPWLTAAEREAVRRSEDPILSLACRWVLKEAFGKALGVGLALPLESIGFGVHAGRIVVEGTSTDGWTFLLRSHADLILGIAHHATPFTPAGKKPPAPPLDR